MATNYDDDDGDYSFVEPCHVYRDECQWWSANDAGKQFEICIRQFRFKLPIIVQVMFRVSRVVVREH